MKKIFLASFFFSIIIINCQQNISNSDTYLDWGIKNNLNISSYIETTLSEKNQIKFIAKTDIPKKKDLLIIPKSLLFNVTKALELLGSKNLKKQYKEFDKLKLTYDPNPYDFRKEETFLAYIFYLIQHKPKKYKKTKFYEFYKNYLKSLDKYSVKSPIFYEQEQLDFLAGTLLSKSIGIVKKVFEDEIDILKGESYNKKDLDFDDYTHYRFVIHNKCLNISNHWTIVPFLNIMNDDYTIYNANYSILENGDVRIFSKKKIKKGTEIILDASKKTNIRRLLLEGKTNEKLVNYFDEYSVSVFSPGIMYHYKLENQEYYSKFYVNLLDKDFESKATKVYLDHVDVLNGDGSDTWAYSILKGNLNFYKQHLDTYTMSNIYDFFSDKDDRENIERIIRGEKRVVEKAIKRMSKTIDQFMEIQEKYLKNDEKENNPEL